MPSPSRFKTLRMVVLLIILVGAAGLAVKKYFLPGPLMNGLRSGGASLQVEIPGPVFQQFDARWAAQTMGKGPGTLEREGCAVCCLAMAFRSKGIQIDPAILNQNIAENHGFTDSGLIIWDSVKAVTHNHFEMVVPEKPTHDEIDQQLTQGNPVLAKVFFGDRLPHWVLLTGKRDLTYVIRDPLGNGNVESLDKYPKGIYAIRYLKAL